MSKCEDHDQCIAEVLDGINSLDGKMDAVLEKVHHVDKEQVRFVCHMENKFIHISKWWAIPTVIIIALSTLAGLIK